MHSAGALHGGVRWEWGAECEEPTVTTTEEASQAEMTDGSPGPKASAVRVPVAESVVRDRWGRAWGLGVMRAGRGVWF